MQTAADPIGAISLRLARHGLSLRGGFHVAEAENLVARNSVPARSLLLVGNAGTSIWPHFRRWLDAREHPPADPLDVWTRCVIERVAGEFSARAVFPFDRPWPPFQQWAMRAEGLRPSPLGILMHPEFGLWHAYRAALLLDIEVPIQLPQAAIHVCDKCSEKPCLTACPVSAFTSAGFSRHDCRDYLARTGRQPGPDCIGDGCAARNACPVGVAYRYAPEQMRFHMAAFAKS